MANDESYDDMLRRLRRMIAEGKGDSEEADALRDVMDVAWMAERKRKNKKMDENSCCETCRFWAEDGATGDCRLNPPVIITRMEVLNGEIKDQAIRDSVFYSTRWPITCCDDWCGKFEQKR